MLCHLHQQLVQSLLCLLIIALLLALFPGSVADVVLSAAAALPFH